MTAPDFLGRKSSLPGRRWSLHCSACDFRQDGYDVAGVCPTCGQPLLVDYASPDPTKWDLLDRWDMWRYAPIMPLKSGEQPVSLGEGIRATVLGASKRAVLIGGTDREMADPRLNEDVLRRVARARCSWC